MNALTRFCAMATMLCVYFTQAGTVSSDEEYPIIPNGTIGCFEQVHTPCVDSPNAPDLTFCSERKCQVIEEVNPETSEIELKWKCPSPSEFYSSSWYPRITPAPLGTDGLDSFITGTTNCGVEFSCNCPNWTPSHNNYPESAKPNCSQGNYVGPGWVVPDQINFGDLCQGAVSGPGE